MVNDQLIHFNRFSLLKVLNHNNPLLKLKIFMIFFDLYLRIFTILLQIEIFKIVF